MIIGISGAVGSGKTTLAKELGKALDFEVIHLNEWAKDFKIEDVPELQTFDFDLDKLLEKVEQFIEKNKDKNMIFEGHFAHFLSPKLVNKLIILNRDLPLLKQEYLKRGYNEEKISDNLEVESFNLCFYEAEEEGYDEKQVKCYENNSSISTIKEKIEVKIKNNTFF